MRRHEPIEDTLIRTLELALRDAECHETRFRLGSPCMMHRALLARLSGALSYHAAIGNKKAGRIEALIDQFDAAYEHATKAQGGAA